MNDIPKICKCFLTLQICSSYFERPSYLNCIFLVVFVFLLRFPLKNRILSEFAPHCRIRTIASKTCNHIHTHELPSDQRLQKPSISHRNCL